MSLARTALEDAAVALVPFLALGALAVLLYLGLNRWG